MVMGRSKGSRFERKMAKVVGDWCGIELMRTPQSGGMGESFPGDLMPKDKLIPFALMIECKHQEGWTFQSLITGWPDYKEVYKWWEQCQSASDSYMYPTIPILLFKKNRCPVLVMMRHADINDSTLCAPILILPDGMIVMLLDNFLEDFDYAYFQRTVSTTGG